MNKKLVKNFKYRQKYSRVLQNTRINQFFNTFNNNSLKILNEKNKFSARKTRTLCLLTTRYRATYSKYRLSRIQIRDLSVTGLLSGLTKSSW